MSQLYGTMQRSMVPHAKATVAKLGTSDPYHFFSYDGEQWEALADRNEGGGYTWSVWPPDSDGGEPTWFYIVDAEGEPLSL